MTVIWEMDLIANGTAIEIFDDEFAFVGVRDHYVAKINLISRRLESTLSQHEGFVFLALNHCSSSCLR